MDIITALIEYLRSKKSITSLEQDILDTWNEWRKNPLDRDSAILQVQKNNINYPDIFAAITALPTTVQKPWSNATDEDVRSNLSTQLIALAEKEREVSPNAQQA